MTRDTKAEPRRVTMYAERGKRRRAIKCVGFETEAEFEIGERVEMIEASAYDRLKAAYEVLEKHCTWLSEYSRGYEGSGPWNSARKALAEARKILEGNMSDVKRYYLHAGSDSEMLEHDNGAWVRHSDYDHIVTELRRERDAANESLGEKVKGWAHSFLELADARREIKKLREQRDMFHKRCLEWGITKLTSEILDKELSK